MNAGKPEDILLLHARWSQEPGNVREYDLCQEIRQKSESCLGKYLIKSELFIICGNTDVW